MIGLSISGTTNSNELTIQIPDELIGKELQIIIIPAAKDKTQQMDFFTDLELQQIAPSQPGTLLTDNEDYSKW
ncbi:MAG: hypothetical protein JWR18_2230 [Segetibacter sp.]|jgi:hypothetical protein|nr:hypothetical protein [Segetibacter sp.]